MATPHLLKRNRTWNILPSTSGHFILGMKNIGKTLETHRLWRELVKLETDDAEKVLLGIVQQRFSIGEAVQVVLCYMHILRLLQANLIKRRPIISKQGERKLSLQAKHLFIGHFTIHGEKGGPAQFMNSLLNG